MHKIHVYSLHVSDSGWGTETADVSGYGKAPAPSRGGLANYRTRPYWTDDNETFCWWSTRSSLLYADSRTCCDGGLVLV